MIKKKYNFLEKSLHYFILNNHFVSDFIFDLEKKLFLKDNDYKNEKHIFISGLARSGSTLLLNILHQNNNFCSLTYNDMPMILGLNLWSKYFKKKTKLIKLEKRAHDDLISINIHSPEAFEEVFWKYVLKNNYITKNYIIDTAISDEILLEYSRFINLICIKYKKNNYLSKNNNSIFRIEKILKNFNQSFFIIPFRDPLSHAFSLMSQHNKFIKLQNEDSFVKKYMNWLGHHEFGLNHKMFMFKNNKNNFNQNSINYWLDIWINYYEYILGIFNNSTNKKRIIFINYNKLCENKNNYLKNIFSKIGIYDLNNSIEIITNKKYKTTNIDKTKLEYANYIYSKLNI